MARKELFSPYRPSTEISEVLGGVLPPKIQSSKNDVFLNMELKNSDFAESYSDRERGRKPITEDEALLWRLRAALLLGYSEANAAALAGCAPSSISLHKRNRTKVMWNGNEWTFDGLIMAWKDGNIFQILARRRVLRLLEDPDLYNHDGNQLAWAVMCKSDPESWGEWEGWEKPKRRRKAPVGIRRSS
jgi:hypothetical protein